MNIQIVSDMHLEFYKDKGEAILNDFNCSKADILLIAGDLAVIKPYYKHIIPILARKAKEVVLVMGNHEYYKKQMVGYMWEHLRKLEDKYPNFHVLDNQFLEIDGINIYGGTMWFDYDPLNIIYENRMSDFSQIRLFRDWVYKKNFEFKANLMNRDTPDIILTHHMPSTACINQKYKGDSLNRFYVSEMSDYIVKKEPKLWVCGHTHDSIDLEINKTKIVSNPLGYPDYYNPMFVGEYIIEL